MYYIKPKELHIINSLQAEDSTMTYIIRKSQFLLASWVVFQQPFLQMFCKCDTTSKCECNSKCEHKGRAVFSHPPAFTVFSVRLARFSEQSRAVSLQARTLTLRQGLKSSLSSRFSKWYEAAA